MVGISDRDKITVELIPRPNIARDGNGEPSFCNVRCQVITMLVDAIVKRHLYSSSLNFSRHGNVVVICQQIWWQKSYARSEGVELSSLAMDS